MTTQAVDVNVNPADETIHLGPLTIHFLVTGEQSAGTVAVFEVMVLQGSGWPEVPLSFPDSSSAPAHLVC